MSRIPGSPAQPDERPSFYFGLPETLQSRIDAVLELLLQIEQHRPDSMGDAPGPTLEDDLLTGDEYKGITLTRVRPVDFRLFEEDELIRESPTETNIHIDPKLFAELAKLRNPKPRVHRLLGKIRDTLTKPQ